MYHFSSSIRAMWACLQFCSDSFLEQNTVRIIKYLKRCSRPCQIQDSRVYLSHDRVYMCTTTANYDCTEVSLDCMYSIVFIFFYIRDICFEVAVKSFVILPVLTSTISVHLFLKSGCCFLTCSSQ